jgi:RNA polymerase sigma-70 factor, ECF subfamily
LNNLNAFDASKSRRHASNVGSFYSGIGLCRGVADAALILLMVPAGWRGIGTQMSSPPPGRALRFPSVWEGNRQGTAKSRQYVPSDEEAMARLQSSHSDALEILFARYSRLVLSIARGVVRDPGEAEDVVQEVFFYLYKKSNLFDASKGSVKNWILQIALHRALDRKSHLARRGFYAGTELESLDDTLPGETDLDREIASKLDRVQLEKAFTQLSEVQRKTLGLFYFEGLGLREISEKLNEPLGNTRHHFYRALERLRKSAFVQRLRESKRCQAASATTRDTEDSGRCVPSQ